jgi:hypothetical protein
MLRDIELPPLLTSDANDLVEELLVPGLRSSLRYDRAVGYFRTTAFALAAQGLSVFLNGGGHMRLLLGADIADCDRQTGQISSSLVTEIRAGLLSADRVVTDHIALLGALLQENRLEIRIATGPIGMFHAKIGKFVDERGDSLVFHGSANETASGWRGNLEQITVHRSWYPAEVAHHDALANSLEGWWRGRSEGFRVLELPDVIGETLLSIAESNPPRPDQNVGPLVEDPVNPITALAGLLRTMPEAEALSSARKSAGFEGARISARLSIPQLLVMAWRQSEAIA